ncbi:MAG: NADH-quinone oxidoreductase subunit K [Rhodobacterales bacterium]|uniref:Multicomponent Na+:H+ antiporter subunit C n=1 Tax=Paracoccus tibetensis TaxID=336292 RepID=A0A1G5K857_9RHOB|nr:MULTISPECIES: NADH-quinone oxidoreductase subunit K [Alphaproteobacteria]MDX5403345.1 NADH-quinone oxidoreductase subunit K [Rhodobacterales bacterium]SCY96813.1 multicomponent Na+:H+ antiporter subunit C [Paracoccus tibetensis]
MEALATGHLFALTGAVLVGLGLFGFITLRHALRQLLAVNVSGAGVFLMLGGLGRGAATTDPFPQALVITGIVVAVALTAFGAALILRQAEEDHAAKEDDERGGKT